MKYMYMHLSMYPSHHSAEKEPLGESGPTPTTRIFPAPR